MLCVLFRLISIRDEAACLWRARQPAQRWEARRCKSPMAQMRVRNRGREWDAPFQVEDPCPTRWVTSSVQTGCSKHCLHGKLAGAIPWRGAPLHRKCTSALAWPPDHDIVVRPRATSTPNSYTYSSFSSSPHSVLATVS